MTRPCGFLCAALVCLMQAEPCRADMPLLSPPVESRLVYANGLVLTLKAPPSGPLESLILADKGMKVSIPRKEMENIVNADLSKVLLADAPMGGPAEREIRVTVEFDLRPYEWGPAAAKVEFLFVGGRYVRRTVAEPTGKDSWRVLEKKNGEPEATRGGGGTLPAEE